MGLHIQLDKSNSTCVDFGGRLSGFFGDLNFSVPSRRYFFVSLAIKNLARNLGGSVTLFVNI